MHQSICLAMTVSKACMYVKAKMRHDLIAVGRLHSLQNRVWLGAGP